MEHDRFRPRLIGTARRAELSRTCNLPRTFLLHVGKIQPRKNLVRVIQAFDLARAAHPDLHLDLGGARGWMDREVEREIDTLQLAPVVHRTGLISDRDLPDIYGLAEALVFPSLYEGFGFPLVEAMASGLPVMTSSTSSLGEVAGDAALRVDPWSVGDIAEAIATILRDASCRDGLQHRGLALARRFTWRRCAAETLACYREVAAQTANRALTTGTTFTRPS